jgi:hypothetical protein
MAVPVRFGGESRVDATASGDQDGASIAALANGKFALTWEGASSGANEVEANTAAPAPKPIPNGFQRKDSSS